MFEGSGAAGGFGRVAVVAVLLVAAGGFIGSGGAAAAEGDGGVRTVYVEDGTIHTVDTSGTVTDFGVSAELVGRARDLDGDGAIEVPFVDGSGTLGTMEPDGDVRTLASDAAASKSTIASGDRDGDGTFEVYYTNTSDSNYVYRVEAAAGSAPSRVTETSANGISGVGDFDGDGADELVFTGSSSTIKYEDGGTVESTGFSSIGSNNGYGLGPIEDFDGDGVARVSIIDGSNNPALVDDTGSKSVLDSNYQSAAKSPVGVVDWTGDDGLELLHLNTSGVVNAMALDGTVTAVTDANGDPVTADSGAGIATTTGVPGPEISDFGATNPDGRTVAVSFDSDTRLENITVRIDGPDGESATLERDAFERSGTGPYTYTSDYAAESDGTYEATLTEAVGVDGNEGAENQSATATVETPTPRVTNATLEIVDGEAPAGENATLRIRGEVDRSDGVNLSVDADASAFGAGTVPLSPQSDGSWAATFDVDVTGVAGNESVTIAAENEYGNADENESDTVFLDTAAPDANVGPDVTVEARTNVTFDADATTDDSSIIEYHWDFGDGGTATGMTQVYAYDEAGTYNATLTATDAAGNAATANRTVTVTERDTDDGEPEISDFGATNPDGRTVAVSFESNRSLETISVRIDGPDGEHATLERSVFERSGTGPYTYTADYAAGSDGEYDAILTDAIDGDGNEGAENQFSTATVETPTPTVTNATLEIADGEAPAGENATLRIRAEVDRSDGVNLSVDADASAFGAGTVPLSPQSDRSWAATFDVDVTGVAGNESVTVAAENEYGNADNAASEAVLLDTAAPDANVGPDVTVKAGTNVTFDADATTDDSSITGYHWAFGDGGTATGMTPVYTYDEAGTYNATLTATDAAGNAATANRTVTVTEANDGTDREQDPEPSVSRTRLGTDTIRYDIANGNAGEDTELAVPVGDHLGRLTLVPASDGDVTVTVGTRDEAPNGTPAVTSEHAVESVAYWNVSHAAETSFEEASFTFSLSDNGTDEEEVTLHRYHDGTWNRFDAAALGGTDDATFYARTPGLSAFALGVDEARLRTESAQLFETDVEVGDRVTARASVHNEGSADGTETLALRADGTTVDERRVTVPAGETRTVLFEYTADRAGTFDVRTDGVAAGTLSVTDPTTDSGEPGFTQPPTPEPTTEEPTETTTTRPTTPEPTTEEPAETTTTRPTTPEPTTAVPTTVRPTTDMPTQSTATTQPTTTETGGTDTPLNPAGPTASTTDSSEAEPSTSDSPTTTRVEQLAGGDDGWLTALISVVALLGGLGTMLVREEEEN